MRKRLMAVALSVIFLATQVGGMFVLTQQIVSAAPLSDIRRISVSDTGLLPNNFVGGASMSADGHYVVFQGSASNLVPNDTNGKFDVFISNTQSNTLTRVSVSSTGQQSNGDSGEPFISADGRFVFFRSNATNLVEADTNGQNDVFMKDLSTGQLTRISTSTNGGQSNGYNASPHASANGRYVLFLSNATNLVPETNSPARLHLYLKDTQTGSLRAIDKSLGGNFANGPIQTANISCDASTIVYSSNATDLVIDDTNGKHDIFIEPLVNPNSLRTNITVDGNEDSIYPVLSCDGSRVAFTSRASNLIANDLNGVDDAFVYDRPSSSFALVTQGSAGQQSTAPTGQIVAISGNGRFVTFVTNYTASMSQPGISSGPLNNLFIRDLLFNKTEVLVLRLNATNVAGPIGANVISNDGTKIAFDSIDANIVTNDSSTTGPDVFFGNYTPQEDITPPVVSASVSPPSPDGNNGWYTSDVTVNWSVTDPSPSSGTPTQPSAVIASQEGEHTYTSAQSCDLAGNCATGSVTLKVDKSNPTISYSVSPVANTNGQHNSAVTVTFDCADSVSGIDSCTAPVSVNTDGQGQMVTGTAIDMAGNMATVTAPVNIDTVVPNVGYTTNVIANAAGWFNSDVLLTWTSTDPSPSSGIPTQPDQTLAQQESTETYISGQSCDPADNCANGSATLSIDKTNPSINYTVSSAANANGWNNGAVTISFNCADLISGIASCSTPVTLANDGLGQTVTGTAVDVAGNTTTITVVVNIDSGNPTIVYAANPSANVYGWNNTNVALNFTCVDILSGIASCNGNTILTAQGVNQTRTGTATDNAGNTTTITTNPINIDKTNPTTTNAAMSSTLVIGAQQVTISANASDGLSGVLNGEYYVDTDPGIGNGVPMTLNGNTLSTQASFTNLGLGFHTVYVRSQDRAGNYSTVSAVTFLRLGGLLPPLL